MYEFDAGPFADLAQSNLGGSLWEFLNDRESFIRLETATLLRRPALEGLQPQLMEKFGKAIAGDRHKQMMGRMVRQIMEARGYALDQTGVRIRPGGLFTSAARYVKK